MSSVEKRALRAGMKKVWSVIASAGAERLRPPVTDSDLA